MVATVNEAYRLDVNVQEAGAPEQSVLVYGWNAQETVVINKTTDVNGDVTTTNIEVKQYDDDGVSPTTTTRTPIKLRALKWGFFYREQELVPTARLAATFFLVANNLLTETVQATVDAYTGITYDDTPSDPNIVMDFTGITPVNNIDRLYDNVHSRYSKAATPPVYDFLEIFGTTDKQNYIYDYDIAISALAPNVFDGQGRSLVRSNSDAAIVAFGGARWSNLTCDFLILSTGSAGTPATENVNVTGSLVFGEQGNYTWDGGTINNIIFDNIGETVNLTLVNGATVTGSISGAGTVNIIQSVPIFVKCIDSITKANVPGVNITLGTGPGLVDVVDNLITDINGEVSTTYAGSTPDTAEGFAAKGSEVPTYVRQAITGPIASGTGFSLTVSLESDD